MLCLSRKAGQRLLIGKNIVVQVVRIAGGRVGLAIDAPADIKILRGELLDKDQPEGTEGREAA